MIFFQCPLSILITFIHVKIDDAEQELLFFACSICCTEKQYAYLFDDIDATYKHWMQKHFMQHREFQFTIEKIAKCLHCEFYSTFAGLQDHHCKEHSAAAFVIVDYYNEHSCALCNYAGSEMNLHFEREHTIILGANVMNPIPLSGNALNAIEQCRGNLNRNQSVRCRCHHCKENIMADNYIPHIMNAHEYHFDCANCEKRSIDLVALAVHEQRSHHLFALNYFLLEFVNLLRHQYYRSEVIFANGLIVNKHCLLSTKYDDSKTFNRFIVQLIDYLIDRYKKAMKKMSMEKLDRFENNRKDIFLTVRGLPITANENLKVLFIDLCALINIVIPKNEIRAIQRKGHNIIVNMCSASLKEYILKHAFGKRMLLGNLIEVPPDQRHSQIFIFN